jgi:CHAT domain-containing protein/Flp pilus assembly protein TadD
MFAHVLPGLWAAAVVACLSVAQQDPPADKRQQRLQERDRHGVRAEELRREGKIVEAIQAGERVLAIEREVLGNNDRKVSVTQAWLTRLYLQREDFPAARRAAQDILRIHIHLLGEKHWQVTDARWDLAYVKRLAELSADERRRLADARELNRKAIRLCLEGKRREAIPLGEKALVVMEEILGKEHPFVATGLNNLAVHYASSGVYGQAITRLRRVLEICTKALGETHPDYAQTLSDLGMLYAAAGDYRRAEPLTRQAVASLKAIFGESHPEYAEGLSRLAMLLGKLGDWSAALAAQRKAVEVLRQVHGKKDPEFGSTVGQLGLLFLMAGDHASAERHLREAAQLAKEFHGETHHDYLRARNNLACLFYFKGDLQAAEKLSREVLEQQKKVLWPGHPTYADSLNNLATLLRDRGDYKGSEPLAHAALESYRQGLGEDHPMYAQGLQNLAALYQAQKRPEKARPLFVRALEVEQSNLQKVFGFSAEGGMHAYLTSVSARGLDALLSALAAERKPDPVGVKTALTWTLRRKGMLFTALARLREAQRYADLDPALAEQAARWRSLRRQLSELPLRQAGTDAEALEQRLARLRKEAVTLEAALHRELTERRPDHFSADAIDTDRVQQVLPPGSALVEVVRVKILNFHVTGGKGHWKPARYLAFVLPAGKGAAPQLVDLGEARVIDEAVWEFRRTLSRAGRAVRNAADEQEEEAEARAAGTQLYRLVFAPLQKFLGPARLVYLAPDGELNRLPFGALPDERGKYLLETYSFAYLCSGRDLLRPRAAGKGSGTVVFAGPDFDLGASARQETAARVLRGLPQKSAVPSYVSRAPDTAGGLWRRLPGAAAEAQVVRAALGKTGYGPVRVYLGPEALEEVFKALPAPRILHVATHGFYLPDPEAPAAAGNEAAAGPLSRAGAGSGPGNALLALGRMKDPLLRSGLCLAGANVARDSGAGEDGWLTAEEISLVDLRGTELVVLSACVSGLGDLRLGEGVYGLRRAFLHAGARTLVTSLFSVPDQETRELMQAFYAALRAGKSRLEALHTAQRDIIRQRRASRGAAHPFFWASFVAVGDPG